MTQRTNVSLKPEIFTLSPQTAELLARPVNGRGGFQSLLRRIQRGLDGVYLEIDVADFNALVRAASAGGLRRMGGFQQRVLALITDGVLNMWDRPAPARAQLELPFRARRPEKPLRVIRGGRP